MAGFVIWRGESRLLQDAPVVAIATTGSSNRKTGKMIQTWIICEDIEPHTAVATGQDAAVCGECPHRHYLGGHCYVVPGQAPLSVYRAFQRGRYQDARTRAQREQIGQDAVVRIGSYGDPGVVPTSVWRDLTRHARHYVGYTHQWRTRPSLRAMCMASVDSVEEATEAAERGWRYYRVRPAADIIAREGGKPREVECPYPRVQCIDCRACDGMSRARDSIRPRASIVIGEH